MGASLRATAVTTVLFGFMFLLFIGIGWIVGTIFWNDWVTGALLFLGIAGLMNLIAYFFSDRIVLTSYRARIVTESEAPRLHLIIRGIAQRAGLPMPRVAIVPNRTPNAFATGRNPKHAVVAVTQGLLEVLDDEELEGVLAHEMAHVRNRDILWMSIAATLAGAISFAARFVFWGTLFGGGRNGENLLIAVIAAVTLPIAALMIQLGISRSREYKADARGAEFTGKPTMLANALRKLDSYNEARPMQSGNPSTAHMFIVNPFSRRGLTRLFSTHPPINERIRRLEKMERDTYMRIR